MKKFLALALVCLFLVPAAVADVPDISGLTFDELITLREKINLAIWQSAEWQEVTVPAGIWVIGEDIPAGHWTIKTYGTLSGPIMHYFKKLDSSGLAPDYLYDDYVLVISSPDMEAYGSTAAHSTDIDMKAGWYFMSDETVIFTPYIGKPDLGFK